jgi:hypothetical protein
MPRSATKAPAIARASERTSWKIAKGEPVDVTSNKIDRPIRRAAAPNFFAPEFLDIVMFCDLRGSASFTKQVPCFSTIRDRISRVSSGDLVQKYIASAFFSENQIYSIHLTIISNFG